MTSINPPAIGNSWALIYDSAASGDFTGIISPSNGEHAVIRISDTLPAVDDPGISIGDHAQIALSQQYGDKLYGKSAGGDARVQLDDGMLPSAMPTGAFEGNRAITIQGYAEANVKRGVEYEASEYIAILPAGGALNVVVQIGSVPMSIKAMGVQIDDKEAIYQIFRSPVHSQGQPVDIFNRNDRNPVAGEITMLRLANIADPGTPISTPFHILGSAGQGQLSTATGGAFGLDHLLAANTEYLIRLLNTSGTDMRANMYITWYEGEVDLPRP